MDNELTSDSPAPSMSRKQFMALKPHINVIIATAVQSEHDQIVLDDLLPNFKARYSPYKVGYLGRFLAVHIKTGQGGVAVAGAVTRAITAIRDDNDSSPVIIVMPGIACGLNRSDSDKTESPIEEIYKHIVDQQLSIACRETIKHVYQQHLNKEEKIVVPDCLTPEKTVNQSGEKINDVVLASKVWEYDREKVKPGNIVEITGELFSSNDIIAPLLAHGDGWSQQYGNGVSVHSGLLVSGDKLIRSFDHREYLKSLKDRQGDKPIAAEMECHGLAASVSDIDDENNRRIARFIFAKAICDWGVAKNDDYQKTAAKASFSFIKYCFSDPNIFTGFVEPINKRLVNNILQDESSSESENALASPVESQDGMIINPAGRDIETGFSDVKWVERVIKDENAE